jgi:hypothetical protein
MKVRDAEMKPTANRMEKRMEITLWASGVGLWLFTESHDIANRHNFGEIPVVAKQSEPFRQNPPVAGSKFSACGGFGVNITILYNGLNAVKFTSTLD